MLPSHLQQQPQQQQQQQQHQQHGGGGGSSSIDSRRSEPSGGRYNNNNNNSRMMSSPTTMQIPLGLTGVVCRSDNIARGERGTLHYTVYRPNHLHHRAPLICVAGGPGLPSQYLIPLVHLINDRSLILYDHVGCGQSLSTTASKAAVYDLQEMVQDLVVLIETLKCTSFHLLGHSFGGILVYEYCRRIEMQQQQESESQQQQSCLSATLASTPTSVAKAVESCFHLQEQIRASLTAASESGGAGGGGLDDTATAEVQQQFSQQHECRIHPLPLPLHQSYVSAGVSSTNAGFHMFRDYDAVNPTETTTATQTTTTTHDGDPDQQPQPLTSTPHKLHTPAAVLILHGQYDFITANICASWTDLWENAQMITLAGCSHYGMLENEDLFGTVLDSFLKQHEPPPKPLVFPPTSTTSARR